MEHSSVRAGKSAVFVEVVMPSATTVVAFDLIQDRGVGSLTGAGLGS